MLTNLVYISSAVSLMSEQELTEMLRQSRDNNQRNNITGMLLYKDGNFMQVIEGEDATVAELHKKILLDSRHKDIMTLLKGPIASRQFGNWSMAFHNINLLSEGERDAFSPFLKEPFTMDYFGKDPHKSLKLLLSFKLGMR